MPLSLKSRLCGKVHVIHCQGRIVTGDEVKSLEAALDMDSREIPRMALNMTPRVLVLDQSADLCSLVKTVVLKHGFNVKPARYFQDARTLLQLFPARQFVNSQSPDS